MSLFLPNNGRQGPARLSQPAIGPVAEPKQQVSARNNPNSAQQYLKTIVEGE
jgi:hypothetical protein